MMDSICRDIFKAIYEGKWLEIEYRNRADENTRYWIGIRNVNPVSRTLDVDAMHLGTYSVAHFERIYIEGILSAKLLEGSYFPVNAALLDDIQVNPHRYRTLFENTANLKILNYLELCNRMDNTPYYKNFALVTMMDRETFRGETYPLSDEQFKEIVHYFRQGKDKKVWKDGRMSIQRLAMNVLSLYTDKGLYVLAYRKLFLDVKNRRLRQDEEITVCHEFAIDQGKESIRRFLDAEDYELLQDFEKNQEKIKDCLMKGGHRKVDDMPYFIGIGTDVVLDLHSEYQSIVDMFENEEVTVPLKAFFGDLLDRPKRTKTWPIALLDHRVNLDQLLAIDNAMKYPVAYIQGPPGTGKTSTIINTIVTAFFNERTVLFASYNNHPINSVFDKLTALEFQGKRIPFPVLRLGNQEKLEEALHYIRTIYEKTKDIPVFEQTLDKRKENRKEHAKQLSNLLRNYDNVLDLKDRREALKSVLDYQSRFSEKSGNALEVMPFTFDLQDRQLRQVNGKIEEIGEIREESAISLLDDDLEELYQYLYFTSARYIKRLKEKKYEKLMTILEMSDREAQMKAWNDYLSQKEHIKSLQRVFPVMITTCISAHKIGGPEPMFDMVILDEASQCNTAVSLVPIIRGHNLMLVGDPQQLNPVILLNEAVNQKLRKKYQVTEEYDYRKNSIYKTFLACDSVSDEVLLRHHYRCNEKIIGFNNKKYYNSKLMVYSDSKEKNPLVFLNMESSTPSMKNTSPAEVAEIVRYAALNKDRSIGVITPFVNQRKLIEEALKKEKLENVVCGTVHAFQGDEKDEVIFSTAITNRTTMGTYDWLKNNKELINVATSRARDRLIVLTSKEDIDRLHHDKEDDLYELVEYVRSNGTSQVSRKQVNSRALGVRPFSTETEEAFLQNLSHALSNIWLSHSGYSVKKEVPVSQVFVNNPGNIDLFYTGRFDFVIYEKQGRDEIPILAIELDGKEHYEDDVVKIRDAKKNQICAEHDLQLIRVENSYARRYNHIKGILIDYFEHRR